MDLKLIEQLTRLLENSGLSVLEVEEMGTRIRLERPSGSVSLSAAPQHVAAGAPVSAAVAANEAAAPAPEPVAEEDSGSQLLEGSPEWNDLKLVTSPMVGVFCSMEKAGKGASPVRDTAVAEGETICLIEAMKLFNEIVMPKDGVIVEVCAKDGETVQYGQVLYRYK